MSILFRNHQWQVEKCGMTAIKHGYFIGCDRINETRLSHPDLFNWPLHMGTKIWVDLEAFCQAFTHALSYYRPNFDRDKLRRSIEEARFQKTESIRFSQMADTMFPNRSWMTASDLQVVADTVRCNSAADRP